MDNIANNLNIKSFITLIFILVPISFVVGPASIEVLNLFLILFFFKKIFENKDLLIDFKNNIILGLFIFNFIILISSLNSDYIGSIKYPLTFFRYILFSLSIYLILCINQILIKNTVYIFLIIFILLFLGSIYEISFKNLCGYFNSDGTFIVEREICLKLKDYLIGSLSRSDRMASFFGDELILGSFVSRFLPFVIGLIFLSYSKFKNPKLLMYSLILLSLIMIVVSGERAALIYFLFFIFIFFCIANEKLIYKIYFLLILFTILVISFFSSNEVNKRMIQSYNQIQISLDKRIIFSPDHHIHAVAAYKIFKDYKILGSGPNTFRILCKEKKYFLNESNIEFDLFKYLDKNQETKNISGCSTHPHNLYLQLLSEIGLVGAIIPLLFQFLLILYITKSIFILYGDKQNNKLRCEILILSTFLISLFPIIPSGNFFNNWLNFVYFYPLGFYLYIKKHV